MCVGSVEMLDKASEAQRKHKVCIPYYGVGAYEVRRMK